MIKFTAHFLTKLEDIFPETNYILRYEKGNFKSGFCILNDQKIVIVNKYFSLDGKINCLIDILRMLEVDVSLFQQKTKDFYLEITQTSISF